MGFFDFFKGKKIKDTTKKPADESLEVRSSAFSEAAMSKTGFNAAAEATKGREVINDVLYRRRNYNIEQAKGWIFEAKHTRGFNIAAAEKGSDARAVMRDSKISCDTVGEKSNCGTPYDMEIYEKGKATGNKIQAKASNDTADSLASHNRPEYEGMQRLVVKGQVEEYKKNPELRKVSEDTDSHLTEEITYVDRKGRVIKSKPVSLEEIKKDPGIQKVENYMLEARYSFKAAAKSGVNAAGTAFLLNTIDDIIENRELDFKETTEKAVTTGVKVGGYTLAKDVVVNKLKYSAGAFSGVMAGLDVAKDIKRIYNMNASGVAKETIYEEVDAAILKAGVGFVSNLLLIVGGSPLSVGVNFLGNKIIQKYFYSEIALHLRDMREQNAALDKDIALIESRISDLDRCIGEFLALVDEVCDERTAIVAALEKDCTQDGIARASIQLTGRSIKKTTDRDIEDIFDDGLII